MNKTPFEIAKPIVEHVIKRLIEEGHQLERVEYDDDDGVDVSSAEQAVDEVFAADFSTVVFDHGWVVFIPENGEDVLSDWSYPASPSNRSKFASDLDAISDELRHYVCHRGHAFPISEANFDRDLIEKRPGHYAVYETVESCAMCNSESLEERTMVPE